MEIKPCPFCGSMGILNERYKWESTPTKEYYVSCGGGNHNCPAYCIEVIRYDTPEEAVNRWNTRYQEEDKWNEKVDYCK